MNLPQDEKSATVSTIVNESKQEIYAGPIPHPDLLKRFQDVDPSFTERILKMAEDNNNARIKDREKSSSANFALSILSQMLTFLLGLSGIAAGVFLATKGYEAGGIAAMLGGFAPIVIAALKNLKK